MILKLCSVLKKFIDYISGCHKNKKLIMSLSDILYMRNDTTCVYYEFLEYFVYSVIGKNKFKYNCCNKLLSEYITVCNEALAILIYKNNIDTWKDLLDNNITKISSVEKIH